MRRDLQQILLTFTLMLLSVSVAFAQSSTVKGKVVDKSGAPLIGASVMIPGTTQGVSTDLSGVFSLRVNKSTSEIEVAYVGYETLVCEVGAKSDLGTITLNEDSTVLQDVVVTQSMAVQRKTPVAISTISADDIQFKISSSEFPEMLKSTPGVHVTKDSGGYGDSKVSMRGFGQENIAVMVNGVPVNDMEWGGIYWSNWAGLTDVTSSMQSQRGLGASKISSPSVGGSINIVTKTIDAKKGGTFTTGVGNDGLMEMGFSVASGLNDKGWAFSILGSKRWGDGYIQGTNFEGYSYFVNVSKRLNAAHQLSLTAFGAPQTHNKRSNGLSIAEWDNVKNYMKGDSQYRYNPSFGYNSNGEAMTANTNSYHKPQISLNHQWQIDYKSSLSTALYVSIGQGGGISGQGNGDYRKYWNGSQDYGRTVATMFRNADGTFAYDQVEELNRNNQGGSLMVLSESINSHVWYGALSTYTNEINDNLEFSGGLDVRYYTGYHKNVITDLFGGDYYIDTDNRGNVKAENNALAANPNWMYEKLEVGDVVYRNYDGHVLSEGLFGQLEWSNNKLSAFASGSLSNTSYWRVDHFYYDEAHGTSDRVDYLGYTAKGGANYNIDEHHNVFLNGGYISRAPFFSGGAFLQKETSNAINPDGVNEKVASVEVGYGFRSQMFTANVNAYYTKWMDKATVRAKAMENGEYARLNMTGVDALHKGIEVDMSFRPAPWVRFTAMASVGDWKWDSVAKGYYYDANGQPLANINDGTLASGIMADDHAWQIVDQKGVRVGGSAQNTGALGMTVYPMKGLRLSADWTVQDNVYADFYLSSSTAAFSTQKVVSPWKAPWGNQFDLSGSYNFKVGGSRMTVYANINNLFDYNYIMDASIDSTADAEWQNVYNVFYSFGRTYTVRLKLNF